MKKTKTLAIAAIVTVTAATVLMATSGVFAEKIKDGTPNLRFGHFMKGFAKGDPTEGLNKTKEMLQQRVKDGKLTQEEADKKIADIEKKANEIQEFNNMTIEQKKEKLLADFTAVINEKVKSGKKNQADADKAIADYKAKLEKWDGTGKTPFKGAIGEADAMRKGGKGLDFRNKSVLDIDGKGTIDPQKMLEERKKNIQQRVADGKLTKEEGDKLIARLEQRAKEAQEFNNMTVEQKREKLLKDFAASTEKRVTDGKLTKEEGDKLIAEFKTKLDAWDGTGRMPFAGMGHKGGRGFKGGFGGVKE